MKIVISLAAAAVMGTLVAPAISQDKPSQQVIISTEPGKGTMTEVIRANGVIEAIDVAKHHVTVKDSHGKVIAMAYGPEVRNLEQLKVGDRVSVSYAQALSLTLMKDGKEIRSKVETTSDNRAEVGQKPGGSIAEKVEITADVTAVDRKKHTITLRGTNTSVELKVRDPAQLKLIKVGDQVQAVYAEAVALVVEPAKK